MSSSANSDAETEVHGAFTSSPGPKLGARPRETEGCSLGLLGSAESPALQGWLVRTDNSPQLKAVPLGAVGRRTQRAPKQGTVALQGLLGRGQRVLRASGGRTDPVGITFTSSLSHGYSSRVTRPIAGQFSRAGLVTRLRGCHVVSVHELLTSPPQTPSPTGSTGWSVLRPPTSEEPRCAPQTPGPRGKEPSPRPWVSGPGEASTAHGRTCLQGGAPAEPMPRDWAGRVRLLTDF